MEEFMHYIGYITLTFIFGFYMKKIRIKNDEKKTYKKIKDIDIKIDLPINNKLSDDDLPINNKLSDNIKIDLPINNKLSGDDIKTDLPINELKIDNNVYGRETPSSVISDISSSNSDEEFIIINEI